MFRLPKPFILSLLVAVCLLPAFSTPADSDLSIRSCRPQSAPITFGVDEIVRTLNKQDIKIKRLSPNEKEAVITVGLVSDAAEWDLPFDTEVPEADESYVIEVDQEDERLFIIGRDSTGAMYGALDLAEQLRWMKDKISIKDVEAKSESPFMPLRGVNLFLHTQAFDDPHSWYYDDDFWQDHIDQLARSRHNFLDIHATYQLVRKSFPNVYPYLFYIEEYPGIGVGKEQAEKNLNQFKKVVDMATDRGIKVGLMSYKASWSNPGNTREKDSNKEDLAEYTALSVKKLIEEVPELYMVGFRIGESGMVASFYKNSYLKGLETAGRTDVHLYSRSWGVTPGNVERIADSYEGKMFLEIKYNGEQLGLPYPVTGGWMVDKHAYAYQNFSNFPRKTPVIWQIRANGTHRIFPWGDPEFVSRTLRACTLIDGVGYTVEPLTAYYPLRDYYSNSVYVDNNFCEYLTERDWFWYELWGRLGYDPGTPEQVWIEMFKDRFGQEAGPMVYRMFVESSQLVPLIYHYRGAGADHRAIAPELEWGGTLQEFAKAMPMEVLCYQSPEEYVDLIENGEFSGKINPLEVSGTLQRHARTSLMLAADAEQTGVKESAWKEFDYMRRNVAAIAALSDYYAHKIRAAVNYEFARRTRLPYFAKELEKDMDAYLAAWEQLVAVTDKAFRPFMETLRKKGLHFHWYKEGKLLAQDIEFVKKLSADIRSEAQEATDIYTAIIPPKTQHPKGGIPIALQMLGAPNASVYGHVRYRSQAEGGGYARTIMHDADSDGIVRHLILPEEIPGESGILEYWIEARSKQSSTRWPLTEQREKPYRVGYGSDTTPPEVKAEPISIDREAGRATITASIKDPGGILWAKVAYKPMPSEYEWTKIEMEPAGDGTFTAEVPMTFEGLQYAFEAVDQSGNGCVWPDVRKQTPYITVEGWAGEKPEKTFRQGPVTASSKAKLVFAESALGATIYTDRNYRMKELPEELSGLTRLMFSNTVAKRGEVIIDLDLEKPMRVYAVFGKRGWSVWSQPQPGWKVYKEDAYRQENKELDIYYRDLPAGSTRFTAFRGGTGVIIGFEPLEQ